MSIQRMLRIGAKIAGPLLTPVESLCCGAKSDQSNYFPVFIVGAPRTGSTVLYQMLTEALDCLYIDNLVHAFSDHVRLGFALSRKIYGSRSHGSFNSTYGNTESLHSPSECGAFWYRWFPRGHDFVDVGDLPDSAIAAMRQDLYSVMNCYQRGIVIKNLNAGQRLRVLNQAYPAAKYVFIRRAPFFTIQSLLQARAKLKIPEDAWWSVRPENFRDLSEMEYLDKIVGQVFFLEKQIVEDAARLPEGSVYTIQYASFRQQFSELIDFVGMPLRQEMDLQSFEFSNKVSVDDLRKSQIETAMKKYDWTDLGYE